MVLTPAVWGEGEEKAVGEVEKKKERVEKEGKSQRKKGENREREREKNQTHNTKKETKRSLMVSIVEVPSRAKDVGSPHG